MYAAADAAFEARLKEKLPSAAFRPLGASYLEEPRGIAQAADALLLAPASTEEVSEVVRLAARYGVPVVPYSGGTGLVGGQVAPELERPVLLSLERLSAIRSVHPLENVLVADAGAILQNVQSAARDADRLFPMALGSQGSARLGGLMSTNAGGANVIRYGNMRDLVLGIEAVLPDGSVFHGLKRLRKDNTGYDLRHLLLGAEGTLGVITGAALKLFPRPVSECAAVMAVTDPLAALHLLTIAKDQIGEGISAFELMSGTGLRMLASALPEIRQPLDPIPDWAVLVDVGLGASGSAEASLAELFEAGFEAGLVQDGVIAQSEAQRQAFWDVREGIPQANRKIGALGSHDISVPLGAIPEMISEGQARLAALSDARINAFGHVGDGNLHYNVFPAEGRTREDYVNVKSAITEAIYDLVDSFGGSISAEHGIGRFKVRELEHYGDPGKLAAMRAIKQALDPKGIMNPGAVLRAA